MQIGAPQCFQAQHEERAKFIAGIYKIKKPLITRLETSQQSPVVSNTSDSSQTCMGLIYLKMFEESPL